MGAVCHARRARKPDRKTKLKPALSRRRRRASGRPSPEPEGAAKNAPVPTDEATDTIAALLEYRGIDRDDPRRKQYEFALLRLFGIPAQPAAKIVGYSPNYSYKLEQKFRHSPKLRAGLEEITRQMPNEYRNHSRLMLPKIAQAEAGAINLCVEDPEKLLKYPRVARQIKESAGVLEPNTPQAPTVNLVKIQQVFAAALQDDEPAVEAEIVQPGDGGE